MNRVFERGPEVDVPHWIEILETEEFERFLAGRRAAPAEEAVKDAVMEDVEALKAQVKKLNARAMEMKMALHDLSEELPAGLEKVMDVARQTQEAFQNLDAARKKLSAATA